MFDTVYSDIRSNCGKQNLDKRLLAASIKK